MLFVDLFSRSSIYGRLSELYFYQWWLNIFRQYDLIIFWHWHSWGNDGTILDRLMCLYSCMISFLNGSLSHNGKFQLHTRNYSVSLMNPWLKYECIQNLNASGITRGLINPQAIICPRCKVCLVWSLLPSLPEMKIKHPEVLHISVPLSLFCLTF